MTGAKLAIDLYKSPRLDRWGRRDFVKGLGALGGCAGLLGFDPRLAAAEPPLGGSRLGPIREYAPANRKKFPYRLWRELNPDDSLRFYALRMRELGIISSTPQKIIAQGTDWRFLNELKKELKA